jgi:hypothetical protein
MSSREVAVTISFIELRIIEEQVQEYKMHRTSIEGVVVAVAWW